MYVPNDVESPNSTDALAARVAELVADNRAVYPVGGGCGLDYGTPPNKPGVALSLAKLNRVVDFPARDMTITVEAGITFAALAEILQAEGQRLPVDVPDPERATVGGALSVNVFGPRRLGCGTFRDWLIGIGYVTDKGEQAKAGGRVVKNVAGYDMGKLLTGALGSLAIITQATFKLQPRPAASALIVCPVADLAAALDAIHASQTRPQAVEFLNASAAEAVGLDRSDCLAVLFEDHFESVNWQVNQVREELKVDCRRLDEPQATALLQKLTASPAVADCRFSLQAGMKPSAVATFVAKVSRHDVRIHAHAMSGVVRIGSVEIANAAEIYSTAFAEIDDDGNVVVRRNTADANIPIWGRPPAALALMKRVKMAMDPRGFLNPGPNGLGLMPIAVNFVVAMNS